ncbi:hypothetical protein FS837_012921 [Tulasnella sp. UAMH 9824]|nr:hypothetical protein FS837_012921 [Tulasnella sp. UAMH 9824]
MDLYQFLMKPVGWIAKIWWGYILPIQLILWIETLKLDVGQDLHKHPEPVVPAPCPAPALIHKLPTELVTEILLSTSKGTGWSPSELQGLASVCKYWRDIILSIPHFWQVIDTRHGRYSWPLVLKRNRIQPLDVRIRGHETLWFGTDPVPQLLQLITPESTRIHSLHFTAKPNTPYFQPFFENTSLPSLISVSASVIPATSVPAAIHIGDGVPFRQLHLNSVAIPWDTPRLQNLEFLSLLNLHHNAPTIDHIRHILRSCPFLQYLSLCNWHATGSPGSGVAQETSPITLPLLENLEVRSVPEDIRSALLSMLDLPAPREVRWIGANDSMFASGPPLLRMSAQCIKASQELVIRCTRQRQDWILSITSNRWTKTPVREDVVDPSKSVDLSIKTRNLFGLLWQVAPLLNNLNSVLFETDSERAANRAKKLFSYFDVFFVAHVARTGRF